MKRLFLGFFAVCLALALISNFAFAQTDPEYKKALSYYNNKKYKEAAELFKEYSKKIRVLTHITAQDIRFIRSVNMKRQMNILKKLI